MSVEVDLPAVYHLAEALRSMGDSSGAGLTSALNGISRDAIAEACGADDAGRQALQGYDQLMAGVNGAGPALEASLVNFGDGLSAGAALVRQVDGHYADAVKATDLGLRPDGTPLPR